MWWHYKGSTFLETSFLPLPSVINVISFIYLFIYFFNSFHSSSQTTQASTNLYNIPLRLIFFMQFFFFKNWFSFLTSTPSNPKEATQWKHILHLAQKFILCSEWRNFSQNANTGQILERNRIVGLPISWFKNLDCSKNWRGKRFKIFKFGLRSNRDDVIINLIII